MATRPRFCYIVLCHTDAHAVLRLSRRIRELSPDAAVLLRHDRPGYLIPRQAAAAGAHLLLSGIHAEWGHRSIVDATLEALQYATALLKADFYVLISGHDYPVRDLLAWEDGVASSGADLLLGDRGEPETDTYRYRWLVVRARGPDVAWRVMGRVWWRLRTAVRPVVILYCPRGEKWWLGIRRLSLLWRSPPVRVVKGSQWMTLSQRAVGRVINSEQSDPRVRRFLLSTKVPDETYLHSLLSAQLDLRVVDRRTTYVHWIEGRSSPAWLDYTNLGTAMRSGAAFARKFPAERLDLRDAVDTRLRTSHWDSIR